MLYISCLLELRGYFVEPLCLFVAFLFQEWTSRLLGLRGFVFDAASARAERVQKRCYRLQFVRAQPNGVRQAYGGYSGQMLFDLLEKLRRGSIERRMKIPHVELLAGQLSGVLAGFCKKQKLAAVHGA